MNGELVQGKLVGFRSWRLAEDGVLPGQPRLETLMSRVGRLELMPQAQPGPPWRTGVNQAQCLRSVMNNYGWAAQPDLQAPVPSHDDGVPARECACGLYAWHQLSMVPVGMADCMVHGAVTAWGQVQVHAHGFRAQYAQPIAFGYSELYTVRGLRMAEQFAHEHGLKLLPWGELEQFAAGYGQPVPAELVPDSDSDLNLPTPAFHFIAGSPGYVAPAGGVVMASANIKLARSAKQAAEAAKQLQKGMQKPEPVKQAARKHENKRRRKLPRWPQQ